jgi:hypothetical protein
MLSEWSALQFYNCTMTVTTLSGRADLQGILTVEGQPENEYQRGRKKAQIVTMPFNMRMLEKFTYIQASS